MKGALAMLLLGCASCGGPMLAQIRMEPVTACSGADCARLVPGEGGKMVEAAVGNEICTGNCVRIHVETWNPRVTTAYMIGGGLIGLGLGAGIGVIKGGETGATLGGAAGGLIGELVGLIAAPAPGGK